jgi:hypothetical protein
MDIKSKVLDNNGNPIAATISLVDMDGNTVKVVGIADDNGTFTVSPTAVDYWDDIYVQVSAAGQKTELYWPESVPTVINLVADTKELGGVVVEAKKPKPPAKKGNYTLAIAMATAALVSIGIFVAKS